MFTYLQQEVFLHEFLTPFIPEDWIHICFSLKSFMAPNIVPRKEHVHS